MPPGLDFRNSDWSPENLFDQEDDDAALGQIPVEYGRCQPSEVFKIIRLVWFCCCLCSKQKAGLSNLQRSLLSTFLWVCLKASFLLLHLLIWQNATSPPALASLSPSDHHRSEGCYCCQIREITAKGLPFIIASFKWMILLTEIICEMYSDLSELNFLIPIEKSILSLNLNHERVLTSFTLKYMLNWPAGSEFIGVVHFVWILHYVSKASQTSKWSFLTWPSPS